MIRFDTKRDVPADIHLCKARSMAIYVLKQRKFCQNLWIRSKYSQEVHPFTKPENTGIGCPFCDIACRNDGALTSSGVVETQEGIIKKRSFRECFVS
jgi:hypothetical protein